MEVKVRRIKKSLLFRYIVGYVAILFIPIFLISALIYTNFFKKIEANTIQTNYNAAANTLNELERTLTELNSMAYKIFDDSKLSFGSPKEDAIKIMEGIDILRRYKSLSEIEKVGLYYSSHDVFYTESGSYDFDMFYEYLTLPEDNKTDFKTQLITSNEEVLNSISTLSSSYYNQKNGYEVSQLIYIVSNPYMFSTKKNAVLFLIDPTYMKSSMNTVDGISLLVDNNKNILLSNLRPGSEDLMNNLHESISEIIGASETEKIRIDAIEYQIVILPSNEYQINYIALIPIQNMMQELNGIKKMYFLSIMLILFVSSFVILFISKYQYKPIQTLAKYTSSLTGKIINSGKNELDSVRLVLKDMNEHTKELDAEILKSKPALKDYYFDNLITGQYESLNQYNLKSQNSGIILSNKSFAIARYGFTCTNDSIPLPAQTIIDIIESHSLDKIQLYAKRGMKSNIITVLICTSYKYNNIIEHLYAIGNLFYEKYNLQYSVGLGEIYNTVQSLGKSYLEAELALSYRMISGTNRVIPIRKIMESNEEYEVHYPSEKFRSLEYAIIEGDVETITKELTAISSIIKSEGMPLFTARCISYDIVNTVVRTMGSVHTKFLFSKQGYPDVMLLAQYKNLDDLVSVVNGICIDICNQILENKESNPEDFIMKVLHYIDIHAFDHDFSLLKIAESLDISQSLISHQFKKQTGQTVITYVNYLRIEKAKKLLLETDLQVTEIVNQIGYYDVSSFTRKFKKEVGVTPGRFRKNSTSKK